MEAVYIGASAFVSCIGCTMNELDNVLFEGHGSQIRKKRISDFDIKEYTDNKEVYSYELSGQYLCAAAKMTMEKIKEENIDMSNIGISIGNTYGSLGTLDRLVTNINEKGIARGVKFRDGLNSILCGAGSKAAIECNIQGANIVNANGGMASYDAVIFAIQLLIHGYVKMVLAGGTDEYSVILEECDENSDNIGLAEGAGTILLSLNKDSIGATCKILGFGKTFCPDDDYESAIIDSIDKALRSSNIDICDIKFILCGSNDENHMDTILLQVMHKLYKEQKKDVSYYSSKWDFGEVAGANGIFSIITAQEILYKQRLPIRSISLSSGHQISDTNRALNNILILDYDMSGLCSCLIIGKE